MGASSYLGACGGPDPGPVPSGPSLRNLHCPQPGLNLLQPERGAVVERTHCSVAG